MMRTDVAVRLMMAVCALCGTGDAQGSPWPEGGPETRPWSYWWWMGSAVDEANLRRELELVRAAGWGGLHIIPIYGAKGWEDRYIEYLSPKWLDMLRYTVSEARRLELGVDMTTGTGWCFGGPNIGPREACATVAVQAFELASGARIEQRFDPGSTQLLAAFSTDGQWVDLKRTLAEDGRVDWTAGPGRWHIWKISQRICRTPVKRAAPGGEGPMLNPFYGAAMESYLERFTQAFGAYDGPLPRAMYHDSFEYGANWSPDLFEEFRRRRGYDLDKEIPSLFGVGDGDRIARVKSDYRETLSDLMVENVMPVWTGWCRRRGILTRYQAHGSPGNLLDLYALADIPETEMFHRDRSTLVAKLASSAAHVSGKRLVAAETGTWLKEHFQETLADLKELVDQLFISGVNHVVYHGTCYSPADAPWPGWLFYASTQMNPRNPIWRDVPALNRYIARVQAVLQSTRPDSDILLYWPIYDLWAQPEGLNINLTVHHRAWLEEQPLGATAGKLWRRGYTFDYVSDRLLSGAHAREGVVAVPGGTYRVVAVPPCHLMPVETLQKLLELARAGVTVLFEGDLPRDVPGLGRLEERRAQFRSLLGQVRLSGAGPVRQAGLGTGRILTGDLLAALERAGVERETLVDRPGLEFVRGAHPRGRYYFLANRGSQPIEGWVPLATRASSALLMDPMSGQTGEAAVRVGGRGKLEVYLQLEAGRSIIVRTASSASGDSRWAYWRAGPQPIPISGLWQVEPVVGGPELPPPFETATLDTWTQRGEAWERFAGTARYRIRFDAPAAGAWLLDLGEVRESARVRLNGRELDTLIASPYRVLLPELERKNNLLEVEVTNLAANRIRDLDRRGVVWRIFRDINFVNIDYKPFDASGWPVRDSGLLGPVTLRAATRFKP